MSKQLKSLVTDALRARYEGIDRACVVDVSGLNVEDTIKLRRELTSRNIRLRVVKNSLARRAFAGGPLETLGNDLSGPCALVTGGDSAIDMAREMVRLAVEFPQLGLKQGILEGESSLVSVPDLAKLMGRTELLSELAGLLSSPGRSLAGCLSSPQSRIAGCLKAMADKSEE
ncbi:MAG: 50S ribosomal protein L10 [Phycisphaerae bacterium]